MWFTAAAAVAAVFGIRWAFGRRQSAPLRVAGLLLLLVVAGWLAGAGGAAITQYAPVWVGDIQTWMKGGAANGQAQGQAQGQG